MILLRHTRHIRYSSIQINRGLSTRITINEQFVRERIVNDRYTLVKRLKKMGRFRFTKPPVDAAVIIPMCDVEGRLSILYTLRSPALYSHGGQVRYGIMILWVLRHTRI